jgi:hypothetical protein
LVLNNALKLDVLTLAYNLSTLEAEVWEPWVLGQALLPNKFQATQGPIVRPCFTRKQNKKTH